MVNYSGWYLMWGCNDESIVSIIVVLYVVLVCLVMCYIDLDGSFDLVWDVVVEGFVLENGIMYLNDKLGLGVI